MKKKFVEYKPVLVLNVHNFHQSFHFIFPLVHSTINSNGDMDTKIYTNSELKDISVTKRVILIGDERCGKTCMSRVFNGKRFQFQYKPILFKVTTKEFRVMDNKVCLL